jgi:hypothetical protein
MGKRSAAEIALDRIDAELSDLSRVRQRLVEAMDAKQKRERKVKAAKPPAMKDEKAS